MIVDQLKLMTRDDMGLDNLTNFMASGFNLHIDAGWTKCFSLHLENVWDNHFLIFS